VSPIILATSTCNNELNMGGPVQQKQHFPVFVRIPEEAMHTRKITAPTTIRHSKAFIK
jgi:putative AlgH/UPF0301 family transcriptional regulator